MELDLKRSCSNLDFELNDEQFEAVKKIIKFFIDSGNRGGFSNKFIRLGGFAGTGKTALISYLLSPEVMCKWKKAKGKKVAIGAPTWKAALVLRGKGVTDAASIHSYLYKGVDTEVAGDDKTQSRLLFQPRSIQEMQAAFEFIILDEASMAGKSMRYDVERAGIPVLYVGDPFQLPPVESESDKVSFMENSEIFLTQISRQALESPIIKLSMQIREGLSYDDHVYNFNDSVIDMFDQREFQIITGFNKTRKHINNYVRTILGADPANLPMIGEKLIGRSNIKELGLYNGQDWLVTNDNSDTPLEKCCEVPIHATTTAIANYGMNSLKTLFPYEYMTCEDRHKPFHNIKDFRARYKMLNDDKIYEVDFAYAITCHVSQGSAFDNVIVVSQRFPKATEKDHRRWLYTAITRAVNNVIIIDGYNEHLVDMRLRN